MYSVLRDDALFCEDRNAKTPTLEDHTQTHLRGPEKLVRTYVYIWKKRDDETGGRKRNRYQLQCQATGVLLRIVLKKYVSTAKNTHTSCTSKVVC